jgi:GAF domain-containing protein
MHLDAAARMREMGWEDPARRAERFAAWARFDLDEPQAARRLYTAANELRRLSGQRLLLGKVLEIALSLGRADRGYLQLANQTTGALQVVAEHGFGFDFVEYLATVNDDRSAFGTAAKRRSQTVIVDVMTDPGFAPHREIAVASGFRAVLSTPLIDRRDRLIGVVSTHYPRPHGPLGRDRQVMERYGEIAGRVMAEHLPRSLGGRVDGWPAAAVTAFRRAARAHDYASKAHERSSQLGVGDVADHEHLAEVHRIAAEADRQRADEIDSQAGAATGMDADGSGTMSLKSQALMRRSRAARARTRAIREQIEQGRSRQEILHDSSFARLRARMETMPVIEQAKGIVMAQRECGPEEAFDVLREMSQRTNVKLNVLAEQIVGHIAASKKDKRRRQ